MADQMEHFYRGIRGWFDCQAVYRWAVGTAQPGGVLVEVGAFLGRSTAFLGVEARNADKGLMIHVVDTWRGSREHQQDPAVLRGTLYQQFLMNMAPVRPIIVPVRKPSVEAAKGYKDKALQFVFIDGSHEQRDVEADLSAWLPKIRTGGAIAGHDIHLASVRAAIERVVAPLALRQLFLAPSCWAFDVR
jgi:hypothetical protein